MVRELDPDKPFSEQKLFTSLAKGERFKQPDDHLQYRPTIPLPGHTVCFPERRQ